MGIVQTRRNGFLDARSPTYTARYKTRRRLNSKFACSSGHSAARRRLRAAAPLARERCAPTVVARVRAAGETPRAGRAPAGSRSRGAAAVAALERAEPDHPAETG